MEDDVQESTQTKRFLLSTRRKEERRKKDGAGGGPWLPPPHWAGKGRRAPAARVSKAGEARRGCGARGRVGMLWESHSRCVLLKSKLTLEIQICIKRT